MKQMTHHNLRLLDWLAVFATNQLHRCRQSSELVPVPASIFRGKKCGIFTSVKILKSADECAASNF